MDSSRSETIVLITRLKNTFDSRLSETFAREGYKVFAIGNRKIEGVALLSQDLKEAASLIESNAGKIDLYIDPSDERSPADDFTVRDGLDERVMRSIYEANVLWPMAALEAFLPLLDKGEGKRLCYVSSAEASTNETRGIDGYAYKMSKAAMHNFFQMISNKLTPSGYTFRVYDPMHREVAPEASACAALNYFTRRRGTENKNTLRDDETRLVFRDALGREHTW